MKVTFLPELPAGEEWDSVRTDVLNALSYFREGCVEFPLELIVQLATTSFGANGLASSSEGAPIMEISYNLMEPHRADYRYVGNSSQITLVDEPDA